MSKRTFRSTPQPYFAEKASELANNEVKVFELKFTDDEFNEEESWYGKKLDHLENGIYKLSNNGTLNCSIVAIECKDILGLLNDANSKISGFYGISAPENERYVSLIVDEGLSIYIYINDGLVSTILDEV